MLPIHQFAEELTGEGFEFRVGATFEHDFPHVVADVELVIVFPVWQSGVEGRRNHLLVIARNRRQLGFDEPPACVQRNWTIEDAYRGNVQWRALALEVEEEGISPGELTLLLTGRHDRLHLGLRTIAS